MNYLLPSFQAVSLIFAVSALGTGAQAIWNPTSFAKAFGIPLGTSMTATSNKDRTNRDGPDLRPSSYYVSLMGARQLSTGIILLIFAYQGKWEAMATVLSVIGIAVAGIDGLYLLKAGNVSRARFHAMPGALIAAHAMAVLYWEEF
ncbi:hypothetical protein DM02DRAFT_707164 [Periconia macrospinosa]|uniref:DUF4267 domain-containing protein n=1 Tax=Periconia macrospinosa TaxID=97972 RepID=A0A2V1DS64_9PLEO|nr:hypothetical protein DM02DRAFT_707164 [Periconia macrospinosa]